MSETALIVLVARLTSGVLFLISGIGKLQHWDDFIDGVIDYRASVVAKALLALQNGTTRLPGTDGPLPNEPLTNSNAKENFLGRAVVEVWSNQSVVAVTGANPDSVAQKAAHRLDSLSRSLEGRW